MTEIHKLRQAILRCRSDLAEMLCIISTDPIEATDLSDKLADFTDHADELVDAVDEWEKEDEPWAV